MKLLRIQLHVCTINGAPGTIQLLVCTCTTKCCTIQSKSCCPTKKYPYMQEHYCAGHVHKKKNHILYKHHLTLTFKDLLTWTFSCSTFNCCWQHLPNIYQFTTFLFPVYTLLNCKDPPILIARVLVNVCTDRLVFSNLFSPLNHFKHQYPIRNWCKSWQCKMFRQNC